MDATIGEVIEARSGAEAKIRASIASAVAEFHQRTGLYVSSVQVDFAEKYVIGDPVVRHHLAGVVVLVQI